MEILGQLEVVEERYEKLNELLSDPDVVSDTKNVLSKKLLRYLENIKISYNK